MTCKWTCLAHEDCRVAGYFRGIGLGMMADELFSRMGTKIAPRGRALGSGLSEAAMACAGALSEVICHVQGRHVVPDVLGNHAPLADPTARAVLSGLGMETTRRLS